MDEQKPRVYVTQIPSRLGEVDSWIPTIDITPAKEHGELKVLLPMGLNYPDAASLHQQINSGLRMFDTRIDCLLALGDPLIQTMAIAYVARIHGLPFKILKWDRNLSRYFAYEITL